MPLSSYLTKPLRWLRAGYPAQAPPHAYVPLIALMPSPAAQVEGPAVRSMVSAADHEELGSLAALHWSVRDRPGSTRRWPS